MKQFFLWMIFILISGCTEAVFQPATTLSDVQTLVHQGELGQARAMLEELNPQVVGQADWEQSSAVLQKRIHVYEQEVSAQADALIAKKQWGDAINLLHDGLYILPDSERLTEKEQVVVLLREQHRLELLREVYARQAQTLIRNQKQVDELSKYHMNDQQTLSVMRESRQQVVDLRQSLVELAGYYIEQDRFDQAEQCLNLAQKLDDDASIKLMMSKLKEKSSGRMLPSRAQEKADAIREVEWALGQGQLKEAGLSLDNLEKKYPNDAQIQSLKIQLGQRIDEQIEAGLEAGRLEYQQRNIQRALSIWEPLLELAPTHDELNRNIQRANRILEKLEQISSEPDGG